jgi:hypothetical protein
LGCRTISGGNVALAATVLLCSILKIVRALPVAVLRGGSSQERRHVGGSYFGRLGYDVVWSYRWVPIFHRNVLSRFGCVCVTRDAVWICEWIY